MNITLVTATVTRDAMTRLTVDVPAHEVEIMQTVFGEDNVQVTNENAGSVELDPSEEGQRLVGKYGDGAITRVYGENYKGAAARACSTHEAKAAKSKAMAPA